MNKNLKNLAKLNNNNQRGGGKIFNFTYFWNYIFGESETVNSVKNYLLSKHNNSLSKSLYKKRLDELPMYNELITKLLEMNKSKEEIYEEVCKIESVFPYNQDNLFNLGCENEYVAWNIPDTQNVTKSLIYKPNLIYL